MNKHVDILIVDDDRDLRVVIMDALQHRGFSFDEAHDGRSALDWLESHPTPRLILLDIMMPGMDGWTFRSSQMMRPSMKNIPVVVMSASAQLVETDLRIGTAGYLKKPFTLEDLMIEIERKINRG